MLLYVFVVFHLFQNQLFEKLSEGQTVFVQIRPDVLLSLIWVQTAYKGYRQTTLVGKEVTRISGIFFFRLLKGYNRRNLHNMKPVHVVQVSCVVHFPQLK